MQYVWNFLLDFSAFFSIILIVYLVFLNKKKKDYSKLKKGDLIKVFIARYNLDMRKQDYKKVLLLYTIVKVFVISFTAALIMSIKSFIWKVLIAFVVVFVLIYALFEILGRTLKKREEKENV